MNSVTVVLRVSEVEMEVLSGLLDLRELANRQPVGEILWWATADFGETVFADIRVRNHQDGPVVDGELWEAGVHVASRTPTKQLIGTHVFVHDGLEYKVRVEKEG